MPRDAPRLSDRPEKESAAAERERVYRCARCRVLVTRGRWEMAMDGAHERSVFNPAGLVFRIACFREAPGVAEFGASSTEFTWFRGYAWTIGLCRSCGVHLGWRYEGSLEPAVFYGLVRARLVVQEEGPDG
ncbi:hypothetical protein HL658_01060 [Azospirillum sp. RWY-5-1]|uniref:CULT domain-containing protein n=1 Tax=Azospirillum oleiclasticum TaxID=2735135 RepID=A0ABX2T1U7_9PROT|nr:hypothetical protein [Azospirillum oleiclasticum]NYZ18285.1 hypothetical protein [Azospirillum oleiclasticum]